MTIKHGREWKRWRLADWLSGNQQKANQRVQNVIMSPGFVRRGTLSAKADRVEIIQTRRARKGDAHQTRHGGNKNERGKLISHPVGHC